MNFSSNPQEKRRKLLNGIPCTKTLELPSELWGNIMNYLAFSDVIQCSAVSQFILHDAIPQITQLSIFRKEELRASIARRFGIKNMIQIDIYCLIKCLDPDENEEFFFLCENTACRIVPFLCNFRNLRSVGLDVDPNGIPLGAYFRDTFIQVDSVEIVRSLVRSICGAYQNGSFSQRLQLYGPAFQAGTFICYKTHGCSLCKMYCESFPVEQAVNARATCISVHERLQIIAKRPNGIKCLASKALVLELLRSNYDVPFTVENSAKELQTKQAKVFSKAVIQELRILCEDYFDTKSLTDQEVLDCMISEDEIEVNEDIWIVEEYFDILTQLGIPMKKQSVSLVSEKRLLSDLHHHM